MPKRTIDFCHDILREFVAKGCNEESEVSEEELRKVIGMTAGALPKNRERYMRVLEEFELIRKLENGNYNLKTSAVTD